MLRLLRCEFLKLKRKKFVIFVMIAAFLFPIPGTALMVNENRGYDFLFGFITAMGVPLLLPIVIGIIGTMLFFMEWDNGTLKNLRTIPLSITELVGAKVLVLFVYSLLFALCIFIGSVIGGFFVGNISGLGEKLIIALLSGVMVGMSSLPLLVIVVMLDQSYIVSILISCFYAFADYFAIYGLTPEMSPAQNLLIGLIPGVVYYKWNVVNTPGKVVDWIAQMGISTPIALIYFVILTIVCFGCMVVVYKRREMR